MGSKGRIPPHIRHPLHGPGIGHPDLFAPGIHPPHVYFPHFDMLPPPVVMEQKLAAHHIEMQKLAIENQRLAATHGALRQELAAAQHELQMLSAHMGAVKSEREQQMRGLMDKIAKMEGELQGADALKMDLQRARADAQSLHAARQELVTKVQQLTQDLQRAHSDMQQIPVMMSELETLRQEYQGCRATYDNEKKLFYDHLESLQEMEKNYITMATEVEKLRAVLTNSANSDTRTGGAYGGTTGYNDNDATGRYPVGQNAYGDGYGAQGRAPFPGGGGGVPDVGAQSKPAPARTAYDAQREPVQPSYDVQRGSGGPGGPIYDAQRGPGGPGYGAQGGHGGHGYGAQGPAGPGYEAQRGPGGSGYDAKGGPGGPGHEAQRGPGGSNYDAQRGPDGLGYDTQGGPGGPGYGTQRGHVGPGYEAQRGSGGAVYDAQRGSAYDLQKGPVYDPAHRGHGYEAREPGYDMHRGSSFDTPKDARYDGSSRSAVGPQGQVGPASNASYGSTTPPTRGGSGFEAPPRGGNPNRR